MMLHKQKSLYEISSKEKADLTDMILVAINEVTKFDPEKQMETDTKKVWIFPTFLLSIRV